MDAYATALKNWLAEPDRTQEGLAEKVGVTQPSMHRYATGERFPERDVAERIDVETGGAVGLAIWQQVAMARLGIGDAPAEAA